MFALPLAIHLQIQDPQQQQYHQRHDLLHRLHTAEQQLQNTLQAVRTTTTNIIVHNNSSTFNSVVNNAGKNTNTSSWAASVLAAAGVGIGGNGLQRYGNGMHNNHATAAASSAMDADHLATQLLSTIPFTPNNSSLSTILQQHRQHHQQTVGRQLTRPPSLAHQSQRSVSLISMDSEEMQDVQSAVTAGSSQPHGAADADLYNARGTSFDHDASDVDDDFAEDDDDELLLVGAPRADGSFSRYPDDDIEPLTGHSITGSVGASGSSSAVRSGGAALQRPQTAAGSARSAQRSDDSMELMEAFVDGASASPVDGELELADEFQQELLRRQLQRAQDSIHASELAAQEEEEGEDVELQLALQASLQESQAEGVDEQQQQQAVEEDAESDDEPEWGSDL